MLAKSLELTNFRNIKNARLDFDNGVNIIFGENAQGKTNIIEALWFFSVGKSFRASKEKEVINFDADFSKIQLDFFSNGRDNTFKIEIPKTGRKAILLNDIALKKVSEIAGNFTSVLFSPEHLTLVKDGPSERRRFMDYALCQLKPRYISLLLEYGKVLEQRNWALKQSFSDSSLYDTLDIWDEKAAKTGSEIIFKRNEFINLALILAKEEHFKLSSGAEELNLKYIWSGDFEPNDKNEIYEFLLKAYKENRKQEIREGISLFGPHRDDIGITLNGYPARHYGSQGQQRSCVLSLKTAEAGLIYNEYGEYPLFLLDDVLSELDTNRQRYIIEKIKDRQVIITCCEAARFENINGSKTFLIDKGQLK